MKILATRSIEISFAANKMMTGGKDWQDLARGRALKVQRCAHGRGRGQGTFIERALLAFADDTVV